MCLNHKLPSRAHRATGHNLGFQEHPPHPSKTHSHGEKATQTPHRQPESLARRKTQPWGSQLTGRPHLSASLLASLLCTFLLVLQEEMFGKC